MHKINPIKKKQTISFILLLIYLLSSGITHEFLKIPELAEHFAQHKEKKNNTSILDFLYKHYCVAHDNDNDDQKDAELPFSCVHINDFNPTFSIKPTLFADLIIIPELIAEQKFLEIKSNSIPYTFLEEIWQPPRIC